MKVRTILTGLAVSIGLFAISDTPLEAQPAYTINFGTVAPTGTPWSDQLESLKKRIESQSQGQIKVKLFLGGALGSEIEMIQDVQRGERLQGGGFSTGAVGEALDIPILEMVELPYLFNNEKQADAVLDDVLYEPTKNALDGKGITFYAWTENGWRSFATKGGPASSPDELRKYKMRSQESPVHLNMYKAMNVQAVAKPVSEVLPSLNTGIVTGFDNTPLFSLAAGWIGPVTHFTLSKHIYQPAAVVYAKSFIDSLPANLQEVVLYDPKGEAARGRSSVRKLESELLNTIESMGKEVVTLTPEQNKAFRQAVRTKTHTSFLQENPEMQSLYTAVNQKKKEVRGQ
jgi:TRAP-type C4-dicarboxylate transport system substrate-binding protein